MPDALELPGVRCAVVPLVRAGDAIVHELVTHWLPRLATVVGALDQLPEPATGLRRIQPIPVSRRALEVVDLPARKVGTTDVPPFALAVRRQDKRTLACTNQYSYSTHPLLLPVRLAGLRRQPMGSSSRCVVERVSSKSTYPAKKIAMARDYDEVQRKSGHDIVSVDTRCHARRSRWKRPAGDLPAQHRGDLALEQLERGAMLLLSQAEAIGVNVEHLVPEL